MILNTSKKMVFEIVNDKWFFPKSCTVKTYMVETTSSYNPIKTSFLAVVIAPGPFLF